MREILFRGKSLKTGKWTQGYLFRCWERAYILWGVVNDNADMTEVDPETVCQYTGLTDKNGRKIFEGDILLKNEHGYIGVAKWECCSFVLDWNSWNASRDLYVWSNSIEVIGNIFDNPELLCGTEVRENESNS